MLFKHNTFNNTVLCWSITHTNVWTEAPGSQYDVEIMATATTWKLTAMGWPVLLTTTTKNSIVWSVVNRHIAT